LSSQNAENSRKNADKECRRMKEACEKEVQNSSMELEELRRSVEEACRKKISDMQIQLKLETDKHTQLMLAVQVILM